MARDIRLLTEHAGVKRSFAWISLLDDGSISVGLLDRLFAVPALASEIEVDGTLHRQLIDLGAVHGEEAISNPHFTFHPYPSSYYHLRANSKPELFSGLLMVDLVVESEGRLPWIRAVSNVVTRLKQFEAPPSGRQIEFIRLQLPTENCSIELVLDFVASNTQYVASSKDMFLQWGGRTIQILARHVEAQKATLWWNHEC